MARTWNEMREAARTEAAAAMAARDETVRDRGGETREAVAIAVHEALGEADAIVSALVAALHEQTRILRNLATSGTQPGADETLAALAQADAALRKAGAG